MDFPLAHDENGCPLEVPATANGWLVRRHAGGRGRPGAVYDQEGRPLVVPLEATATDLRACGCQPATYRLDAVDSMRKPLGVTAYTEVRRDAYAGAEDDLAGPVGPSDAAVAALARAVEAMQRVQAERERAQAERERAQAEMLARLIERLAPPLPPPVPRNMPDVLREYGDVQEIIRKLVPKPEKEREREPAVEEEEESGSPVLDTIAQVVEQVVTALMPLVREKLASSWMQSANQNADDERQEAESETDTKAEPGAGKATAAGRGSELDDKLTAVLALLSAEEAEQLRRLSEQVPPAVLDQAVRQLLVLTTEQAVIEIRKLLGQFGGGASKPRAEAKPKQKTEPVASEPKGAAA